MALKVTLMLLRSFFFILFAFGIASASFAQIAAETPTDAYREYGETVAVRYKVGASIDAKNGPVQDVIAMVAVPFECDEQEVIVTDEDISPEIESIEYRTLNNGARQMVISLPYLAGGTEAHAILTFEVRTKKILPPDESLTAALVPPKKPDRDLKRYLGRSKYIQTNDGKIRRTLKGILSGELKPKSKQDDDKVADAVELTVFSTDEHSPAAEEGEETSSEPPAELNAWQRIEKIYDYVQGTIEYREGNDQSAVDVLESGVGDCHDISALFVALCRAHKIPARMVWVHEHQYPEFCLADAEGNLHWFPSESSGMRAFGEMPTARVIMQKGDNFNVPERKQPVRYATDYLTGKPVPGSGRPKVRYIREML